MRGEGTAGGIDREMRKPRVLQTIIQEHWSPCWCLSLWSQGLEGRVTS